MYGIEESTLLTLLGLFDAPRSHSAPPQRFGAPIVIWRPGSCDPLAPLRYALNSTRA